LGRARVFELLRLGRFDDDKRRLGSCVIRSRGSYRYSAESLRAGDDAWHDGRHAACGNAHGGGHPKSCAPKRLPRLELCVGDALQDGDERLAALMRAFDLDAHLMRAERLGRDQQEDGLRRVDLFAYTNEIGEARYVVAFVVPGRETRRLERVGNGDRDVGVLFNVADENVGYGEGLLTG